MYVCVFFFVFLLFSFISVSHFKSCLELTIGFMGVYQITQRTIAFWKAWPGIQWRAFVQPRLYGTSFCSIYLINREIFCITIVSSLQFDINLIKVQDGGISYYIIWSPSLHTFVYFFYLINHKTKDISFIIF